jgi:alanine-glyoxylate transaminase/serine-glyoxylate transaminase/serine-pyruvate transaminase
MARVTEALRADRAGAIRAVMVCHVDTSSTIRTDVAALRAAIDAAGHPALLVVDCIASLGCDAYRMDAWGADVTIAASQKGLMTPPGMAFCWFNARAAALRGDLCTPYWNWHTRANPGEYWHIWCGTAPTHHLYGLRAALDMIGEEGLAAIWDRHDRLARMVWAAVDGWATANPAIRLNVADPDHRGRSVTSVTLGAPDALRLRRWVEAEAGVTLGIGLGMATEADPGAEGWLRIAHMGHVNLHMTLGALAAMEAGMSALGIAHGPGLSAAARLAAHP